MGSGHNLLEAASNALQRQEFSQAESILDGINRQPDQRSWQSLLLHGVSLEALKRLDEAVVALSEAEKLAAEPREKAKILNKASAILQQKKNLVLADMEQIAQYLEKSVAFDSSAANAMADLNLCMTYYKIRRYDAVATCASRLLEFSEYKIVANLWLARACYFLDQKTQGLTCLSAVEEALDQLNDQDLFGLLELLIDYRCLARAQAVIDRLDGERRSTVWLRQLQAGVYFEENKFSEVLAVLPDSLVRTCSDKALANGLYSLRARAQQATGGYREAHNSFTAMNRLVRDAHKSLISEDVISGYAGMSLRNLPLFPDSQPRPYTPVFMIGFPRSGTTLLDTILATQNEIRTLSEVDGILAVRQKITDTGKMWPDEGAALTARDVDRLRDIYYEHNELFLRDDEHFSVLIDKLPLNIVHLPLIKMLFPQAKYIFSLRHPVDVCLSCFQQNFSMNIEMFHFTDLENCFIRYRDVMRLFERYRAELDLNLHTVRYEDLIADLDSVADGVFHFLGVQADESYRDFHKLNEQRLIVTPSREQVSRPIYRSSRNRWKNYAAQLQPHIPLVQQFIAEYGYTV